jgi:hypothetical protein
LKPGKLRPSSRAVDPAIVAAFDAMVAARPLKPPPLPRYTSRVRSAGELELIREKQLGLHSVEGLYVHGN